MESLARAVRLGVDVPRPVPSMERSRHLSTAVREARQVLRRRLRSRVGAATRPVRIRRTEASPASSVTSSPTVEACHWPPRSLPRTCTTSGRTSRQLTRSSCERLAAPGDRQYLCLDKGYDFDDVDREIRARGIRPHIRRRGETPRSCRRGRARRWVVERTNAWHNRFRALLIRWERRGTNYLALLHLACAMIALRHTT